MFTLFNLTDWIILSLLLISALFGVWRGFVREVLAIVTWVLAAYLGIKYSNVAADMLVEWINVASIREFLGFFIIFLIILIAGELLNLLLRRVVSISGLGALNRCLGLVFGLMRGFLGAAVVVLFTSNTVVAKQEFWQQSKILPLLEIAVEHSKQYLPEEVFEKIDADRELVVKSVYLKEQLI